MEGRAWGAPGSAGRAESTHLNLSGDIDRNAAGLRAAGQGMEVHMSTPLPERASLEQLRKQAKEMRKSGEYPTLAAAQFALAQSHGFPSWPKLVLAVQQKAVQIAIRDGLTDELKKLLGRNLTRSSGPNRAPSRSLSEPAGAFSSLWPISSPPAPI